MAPLHFPRSFSNFIVLINRKVLAILIFHVLAYLAGSVFFVSCHSEFFVLFTMAGRCRKLFKVKLKMISTFSFINIKSLEVREKWRGDFWHVWGKHHIFKTSYCPGLLLQFLLKKTIKKTAKEALHFEWKSSCT